MAIATQLTGYKHVCRRSTGGVSKIGYIKVSDIASVTIEEKVVTAIEFAEGKHFIEYQSALDKSEFSFSGGEVSILNHFNAMSKESSIAYNELLDNAACGLVACVKMNNGAVALVGWTEEFGGERPLMTIESSGTSGKAVADENYLESTLKSSQATAPLYLSEELASQVNTLFATAATAA